jgi:hypothetical protein
LRDLLAQGGKLRDVGVDVGRLPRETLARGRMGRDEEPALPKLLENALNRQIGGYGERVRVGCRVARRRPNRTGNDGGDRDPAAPVTERKPLGAGAFGRGW